MLQASWYLRRKSFGAISLTTDSEGSMRPVLGSERLRSLSPLIIAIALGMAGCSADKVPGAMSGRNNAGSDAIQNPDDPTSPNGLGQGGSEGSDNPTQLVPTQGTAGGGVSSVSAGSGASGVPACVTTAQEAMQVPVDMYIMLDRSDSMTEKTGAGPTKWDAIRIALDQFLQDSRSAGLGVGLQYFPITKDGVPDACTQDSDCGPGGPCFNGVCKPNTSPFALIGCAADSDCPSTDYDGCTHDVGQCSLDNTLWCFDIGFGGCGLGLGSAGTCQRVNIGGFCSGADSCDAGVYAKPAVEIGALPDHAQTLIASLDATMTAGRTPTAAALSGALQQAKDYAQSQTTHRVVAVLATDGLPTECDPLDAAGVGDLARDALAGTPKVPTYVVGVFGPDDTDAKGNLDTWAAAGGTDSAFIVDPTQDVAKQFLDALDTIRSGSIACEYQLPPSPKGSDLDLDRVNVALVEGSKTSDFLYVGDESRCNLTPLGWHYDADPASGKATKIVVCDSACDTLKSTDNGRVEVRLGCKTMGPD
jgi:hypothetical protein